MTNKVVVKRADSWNFVQFHLNLQVSKSQQHFLAPYRQTCDHYLVEVGEPGATLVRRLLGLEGVETVSIERYMVSVTRGVAFDEAFVGKLALDVIVKSLQIEVVEGPKWATDKPADVAGAMPN